MEGPLSAPTAALLALGEARAQRLQRGRLPGQAITPRPMDIVSASSGYSIAPGAVRDSRRGGAPPAALDRGTGPIPGIRSHILSYRLVLGRFDAPQPADIDGMLNTTILPEAYKSGARLECRRRSRSI